MTDEVVNAPAPAEPAQTEEFAPIDLDAVVAQIENLPEGADADSQESPGETQAAEVKGEPSPIEPPKSWTKEAKERWASLPRETQEYLAERESEREREFHQRQREVSEQRKALDIERNRAAYLRQQYEQSLPHLYGTMQAQIAGDFADIKTWADVEKMQAEDPFRFQKYQVAAAKLQGYQQELTRVQQRQAQDMAAQWQQFAREQDAKFAEQAPDYADPEKSKAAREKAREVLRDLGFTDAEVANGWNGRNGISLRDHRFQRALVEMVKLREAEAKARAAKPIVKPAPITPGSAQPNRVANELQAAADSGDMEKYFAMRSKGRVR